MGKSFQILTISGIPLKIHWSFPLLFLYIFYQVISLNDGWTVEPEDWNTMLIMSLFVSSLFICVVLHELGHAFAARRYGVDTVDIILSPIGGVARLTKLPTKPIQEFVVAIAGPLVNVVIAILIAILFFLIQGNLNVNIFDPDVFYQGDAIQFMIAVLFLNLLLVVFNLIPAFPMDGGRIFRALLSMKFSRLNATRAASLIGQVFALGFIFYAVQSGENFTLGIIGVFIFIAAPSEYRMVKVSEMLKKRTAREIMRTEFTVFTPEMSIAEAEPYLKRDLRGDYVIQGEDRDFRGIITRGSLVKAIQNNHQIHPVLSYASNRVVIVHPTELMDTLFTKMQEEGISDFVVQDENGQLLGLIDVKRMNDFLHQEQRNNQSGILKWLRKKRENLSRK